MATNEPKVTIDPNATIDTGPKPSRTYQIDFATGRIAGKVDGLDAIKQTIFAIFNTLRYEHGIYSHNYGIDLDGIVGSDRAFLKSELPRRIREALTQDDRITDVTDFKFTFDSDEATVEFTVVTLLGEFRQPFSIPQSGGI